MADALIAEGRVTAWQNEYGDQRADVAGRPVMPTKVATLRPRPQPGFAYAVAMIDLPDWARHLDLAPHPEGGWFRETWRSELTIGAAALPADYAGARSAGTAILFLLMPGQQSAWHTVRGAELWFHHRGGPLLLEIGPDKDSATTHVLGSDIAGGEQPQVVVPPGHWQRARPRGAQAGLVSCVVVPGFDFADFTLHG